MLRVLVIIAVATSPGFGQATATTDNAPPTGSRAKQFVEVTQNRPPRENLTRALEMFAEELAAARRHGPLRAADLGAGAGNESLHLMKLGWQVTAIDSEPYSAETINKYATELKDSSDSDLGTIHAIHSRMEDMDLAADSLHLVNASFSLPFVSRQDIDDVWAECVTALKSGGLFTGHFFGPNHEWRDNPRMSFFSVNELFERFVQDYPLEVRYLLHEAREVNLAVGDTAYFDTITVIMRKK